MAEYSTPVYPHGTGPPAITDQITDQNTPYCSELRYAVSNDIRVLAVTQRRDREPTSVWGHHFKAHLSSLSIDNLLITFS